MSDYLKYLDWIDGEHETMCKTLVEWSHINSGSLNTDGLAKMSKAIQEKFKSLNADIKEIDLSPYQFINSNGESSSTSLGKAISIKKRPNAKLKILLVGHMDTVFDINHSFQRTHQIDKNMLRGPGVADLKGGLLVMLKALEAFETYAKDNDKKDIGWEILINPDEEIGSPGSAAPIAEAAKRNHIGLVYEPSLPDGTLVSERKGSGNFTVIAKGIAVHSGREFEKGRNAIYAISKFISKAHDLNKKFPDITLNIGTIEGGKAVNIVPDLAICKFGIRTQKTKNETEIKEALDKILKEINKEDGISIEIHGSFNRKPKILTKEITKLFEFLKSCASDVNVNLDWKPTGGCCDGNNLAAAGLPNLDTLGVRGANIHTEKEYVLLDSLTERAKISALLLMKLASGDLEWTEN